MLLLVCIASAFGQSLFDDAVSSSETDKPGKNSTNYELNGYVKGVFYGGEIPEENQFETRSRYAEASLKLSARKGSSGNAYAELRFRKGYEFGSGIEEVDLREAYIKVYPGRFDLSLGQQIVAWGRADGFNPTDNISPRNILVRSPNEDDRRLSSFLLRTYYNVSDLRFEGIWIPTYEPSTMPFEIIDLAPGVTFINPDLPDENLKNCGFALKLNLEKSALDGSLSYFNGFNTQPGLDIHRISGDSSGITPEAYRMHVMGSDFATTVPGDYGFRGEFAYRRPYGDYENTLHVINPDIQYTVGIDRQIGLEGSFILQYMGRYVLDFEKCVLPDYSNPDAMARYQLELKNRMISSQQEEITHSLSLRPAWTLFYETLNVEVLGLYNITTEELYLRPKFSYDIADDLSVTLGGDFYSGPAGTLYAIVKKELNSVYVELKASF